MHDENIHSLIIRLFDGEATFDEKSKVREWLNQTEDNRKMYSDLQEVWLKTGVDTDSDNYRVNDAIKNFKWRIRFAENRRKKYNFTEILKYASIFLLLISLPFFYYSGQNNSHSNELFTTISCAFGDKSKVQLPDGSTVYLNSGSKLTYNNNYKSGYRLAKLEGEAYFEIAHNSELPFKVTASDIEIEVLGTEFNVKAYADEKIATTTLAKGSIAISTDNHKSTIKPNQKVIYNKVDKKMTLYNLKDIAPEIEWKEGRLVFRNESLEDLELELERWFDVDIVFADEQVKKRKFTGILERESILETVSYFNYSRQVGYKIENNEITFFSK